MRGSKRWQSTREEVLHVAQARAACADRRRDRAAHERARQDPRRGRHRRRARSRGRRARRPIRSTSSTSGTRMSLATRFLSMTCSRTRPKRERALPGSGMAPVVDTLRLTAEGAKELLETGELTSAELRAAYLDAIEERDGELHCFLRTAESDGQRRSDRAQGRDLHEGRRDDRGLANPRGLRPRLRRHRRRARQGSRSAAARQDEHRRVRDGLVDRELGLGPFAQPLGSHARSRRLWRWVGGGGHGRAHAVGARLGHGRLDQAALGAVRERRPAPDLRERLSLRRRRLRVQPRSGRPGGEDRSRRRPPVLDHLRTRPV